jgi:stage V sporulation protein SpoVS
MLGHKDPVQREAAVARLRVAGATAFSPLARFVQSGAPPASVAGALAALEGCEDPRAIGVARHALAGPDVDVALAAIGVLRGWLNEEQGLEAIEALTVVALDRERPGPLRLAALDALSDLPSHLVAPIRATSALEPGPAPTDDPGRALEWLTTHTANVSLAAVHEVLSASREAERVAASDQRREDWRRVRGAAHMALARRGSRLALYDLRDALGAATRPLPLDFLTAVAEVGDESCLDALARAWTLAGAEPWWRNRLAEAAHDVMTRHRLSGRHAVVRRLRDKWPPFYAAVSVPRHPHAPARAT